jgi:hypothetical protein
MRLVVVVLAAMIVGSCGSQANHPSATRTASSSHSPTSSAAATSSSPVLFAVLETRRTGAHESEYAGSHDTIAIAGPDGYAHARATFTPRSIPQIPMAGPVMQPEAAIAAGGVYFIDGTGVVRRLDASGTVRKVTTFPITSPQQAVSFVVSPDGKQLMATVLTYPNVIPNPSPSTGPPFTVSGSWMLDLEKAADGGSATVVKHWQSGPTDYPGTSTGFHNLVLVGWDSHGPLAMVDGYNGAQQTLFDGQHWAGGHLVRLSVGGAIGSNQGPSGCTAFWVDSQGDLICTTGNYPGTAEVGTVDGHVASSTAVNDTQQGQPGGFALSPNGLRLAMNGQIANRNGSTIALPDDFLTRGWLDDGTVIGMLTSAGNPIAVYHLDTSKLESWSFSGQFVGVLH